VWYVLRGYNKRKTEDGGRSEAASKSKPIRSSPRKRGPRPSLVTVLTPRSLLDLASAGLYLDEDERLAKAGIGTQGAPEGLGPRLRGDERRWSSDLRHPTPSA
jgi:hypothetical protein